MKGRRIADRVCGTLDGVQPGDYWRNAFTGTFYATCPVLDPAVGLVLASLCSHSIVEHEDGTISVQPSIRVTGGPGGTKELYHGFLENGSWRNA
jgi:hypothetical protein